MIKKVNVTESCVNIEQVWQSIIFGFTYEFSVHKDATFLAKFRASDLEPVVLKQIIDIFANRSFASLFLMMTQVWSEVSPNRGFMHVLI